MELIWLREQAPVWDAGKAAVFIADQCGQFSATATGVPLANDWWRVQSGSETVAYCRMDCTWGDIEFLIVVRPGSRGKGVGSFALRQLEAESASRGVNYLRTAPPLAAADHIRARRWLLAHGFKAMDGGEYYKRVGGSRQPGRLNRAEEDTNWR
jgi:GNAT superfamily N-acetyltransferase